MNESPSGNDELRKILQQQLSNRPDLIQPDQRENGYADRSHPLSTRFQKWIVLSIALALLGLLSEVISVVLNGQTITYVNTFGKGELYMVGIGMLFSATGELLYDRTRHGAGAWQISLSLSALILTTLFAISYGYTKAGKSTPEDVANLSLIAVSISLIIGSIMIIITGRGGGGPGESR